MSSAPGEPYVEGPRHAVITPDNVGPAITIVTLFLMVIMILAVALRLLVRFTTSRVPGYDDTFVSMALVIALGEVISTCLTVERGLGTRRALLSNTQWTNIEKGLFSSAILYILTVALAKASALLLLYRLTVSMRHKIAVRALAAITFAWTLAAIFGISFGCDLPNTWDVTSQTCFDVISYWTAIGIVDILLDVALIATPAWLIWSLHLPWGRKFFVIFGFAIRIVLIAAQLTRLVYLTRFSSRDDGVQTTLGYILATQFETLFAVVVACVPAYRPFMEAAASGLIGVSFRDRKGTYELSSVNQNRSFPQDGSKKGSNDASRSRSKAHIFEPDSAAELAAASRKNSRASPQADARPSQAIAEWDSPFSDELRLHERHGWQSEARIDESLEIPSSTSSTARFEDDML